jgi:transposase
MQQLSTSAKQAIIKKALTKEGSTLAQIAKESNIGVSTLGRWLRDYRKDGTISGQNTEISNNSLPLSERFQHIMATASLDEAAVGIYCRENGLYSFQLTEWKEAFMTQKNTVTQESSLAELKALRTENKQLRQEVRRKDSALAEATALLILKKKVSLIWGEHGDD